MPRKKNEAAANQIVNGSPIIEESIIDEYKKLNDKCDSVITKIKKRKNSSRKEVSNV
jgi:hypothetical protein